MYDIKFVSSSEAVCIGSVRTTLGTIIVRVAEITANRTKRNEKRGR